jgi:hypothetical protein
MRKPTWLYFCGVDLRTVIDALPPPREPADCYRTLRPGKTWYRSGYDMAGPTERKRTPASMAAWLADLARTAEVGQP